MMEWAETFGADIAPLSRRLMDLERDMDGAIDDYIDQDYPPAITFLQSVSSKVTKMADDAIRLKDRALLWIYVIEWAVATATILISGMVIWTLMVRRRLYRDISGTRLSRVYD
jgi:hypothetical protein